MDDVFADVAAKTAKYAGKYHNHPRTGLLRSAVYCLKMLLRYRTHHSGQRDEKLHVGVIFRGGIGDHVINAKYVAALKRYLETAVVDVLVRPEDETAIRGLFYRQPAVNKVVLWPRRKRDFRGYDLVLSICRYPLITAVDNKRLSAAGLPQAERYVQQLQQFAEKYFPALQFDIFGDRLAMVWQRRRDDEADIGGLLEMNKTRFWIECEKNAAGVLSKFGLNRPYITLQCGGGVWVEGKKDVRQWPVENYEKLCALLKKKYPQYRIVQLGGVRQPAIRGVDDDLRGKTDFEELKILLQTAEMHIQQDGGMVYLRHYLTDKPSCVLFGPNDVAFFGYDNNVNIRNSDCPACSGLGSEWMKQCLRGGAEPLCMRAITPEIVMARIEDKLC